jgi:hypothetical protein
MGKNAVAASVQQTAMKKARLDILSERLRVVDNFSVIESFPSTHVLQSSNDGSAGAATNGNWKSLSVRRLVIAA